MSNILPLRRPAIARLECSQCGATADAACNCGAPYLPASARAAEAIAAAPEKSDRAIAAEIGVGKDTVRRARSTGAHAPVAKRTGKDGKKRKLPTKPVKDNLSNLSEATIKEIGVALAEIKSPAQQCIKAAELVDAATHRTGAETDCEYLHLFYDGTCHELPTNKNSHDPEWIKWRQDHAGQWHWRPLRHAHYEGDKYLRPGPWRYPDGTKVREYDAHKVAIAFKAFEKAVRTLFPRLDPDTVERAKALVAAWEKRKS